MGKKKRKSKSKFRNLNYSKMEFIENICSQCKICKKGTNPLFCYDETYTKDPKFFMSVIYKNIIEARDWLIDTGKSGLRPDADIQHIFQMGFCESDYCGHRPNITEESCKYIVGCLSAFRNQTNDPKGNVINLSEYRGRNEKNRQKTKTEKAKSRVYAPEPGFFCNEGFREEVDKIVREYIENRGED